MFLAQGLVLKNWASICGIILESVRNCDPLRGDSLVSGSMLWGNRYIFQGLRLNLQQSMSQ